MFGHVFCTVTLSTASQKPLTIILILFENVKGTTVIISEFLRLITISMGRDFPRRGGWRRRCRMTLISV